MAVKLGVALGCDVTVITGSESKRADALALGAHRVLLSSDKESVAAAASGLDLIIDTIPVAHEFETMLSLLDVEGTLVLVGAIAQMPGYHSRSLLRGRRSLTASPIGGLAETQALLDFCAEKGVLPDCEMIPMAACCRGWRRSTRRSCAT